MNGQSGGGRFVVPVEALNTVQGKPLLNKHEMRTNYEESRTTHWYR